MLYARIAERMAPALDGDRGGHDLYHAWRVFSLGVEIAAAEDADPSPEWVPWEDDTDDAPIDHFRAKLLQLRDDINTETARALADERHACLLEFVDQFEREWHGEG
jgi:HD superfamily phosphodiesterase